MHATHCFAATYCYTWLHIVVTCIYSESDCPGDIILSPSTIHYPSLVIVILSCAILCKSTWRINVASYRDFGTLERLQVACCYILLYYRGFVDPLMLLKKSSTTTTAIIIKYATSCSCRWLIIRTRLLRVSTQKIYIVIIIAIPEAWFLWYLEPLSMHDVFIIPMAELIVIQVHTYMSIVINYCIIYCILTVQLYAWSIMIGHALT